MSHLKYNLETFCCLKILDFIKKKKLTIPTSVKRWLHWQIFMSMMLSAHRTENILQHTGQFDYLILASQV